MKRGIIKIDEEKCDGSGRTATRELLCPVLFLVQVTFHFLLIETLGFPLFNSDRSLGTLSEAGSEAIAVCLADELASAAELVMGQADEGIPLAIIRGVEYVSDEGSAFQILRSTKENLFD